MDAFFASVEQLDNPELRGKPVAVGGSEKRGVIAAASYEARKFGVRSAMPSITAKRLCPDLIFVSGHFERYREISQQIREIFCEYTDLVQPVAFDEAYLDVTKNNFNNPSATKIALEIKQKIKERTGLTASAGISFNKFLAKLASDYRKPDGITLIDPDHAQAFVDHVLIGDFHGVGKVVTEQKMKALEIYTGKDLKDQSLEFLTEKFGKMGQYFYNISRCIDDRPVNPNRIVKSVGIETTFLDDKQDNKDILPELEKLSFGLEKRLEKRKKAGSTFTLKLKYNNFKLTTRSKTVEKPVSKAPQFYELAKELLSKTPLERPIRLAGISVHKLEEIQNLNSSS
jgi:DNA polymerase-4